MAKIGYKIANNYLAFNIRFSRIARIKPSTTISERSKNILRLRNTLFPLRHEIDSCFAATGFNTTNSGRKKMPCVLSMENAISACLLKDVLSLGQDDLREIVVYCDSKDKNINAKSRKGYCLVRGIDS